MLERMSIALIVLLIGAGCMQKQTLHDTKTVHNPEATRIWIVQGLGDDQYVVYCDAAAFAQTKTLCTRWPAAVTYVTGNQAPAPPSSPP